MAITPPTAITIAPIEEDEEEEDIIMSEIPGRNGTDTTIPTIKPEPPDTYTTPTPTTTTTAATSILPTIISTSRPPNVTIVRSAGTSGIAAGNLRSLVSVTRGIFRFSSTSPTTARPSTATTSSSPVFLIPTSRQATAGGLSIVRQPSPFKLIPIQPKSKTQQAVVAPQTKQSVVISGANVASPHTVSTSLRKGIISFSAENPEELVIGRSETIVNPRYGVAGMIFNSRTVTGGGRVKYNKDYLCNLCKHMSDSSSRFKAHFTSSHLFSCDYCSHKAFSRYEVVMHTKSKHSEAIEDLKGYEMFEDPAGIPVMTPSAAAVVSATTATTSSVTKTTSGLITIPVVGTQNDKLLLKPSKPNPAVSGDASVGSYFTYKIVVDKSKSEPKKYECDLCQYQTTALSTMYDHASTHTMSDLAKNTQSSTTWECFYCNFKSLQQAVVVKHVSAAHPSKHIQLKRYTSTSVVKPGTSLINNIRSTAAENSGPVVIPDDSPEKSDSEKTKNKPDEEEDDDTAMWGCYYCKHEDRDRHNVVAHVKADHAGRKIVITRRRLQTKDSGDENEKPDEKEAEKKDGEAEQRKNYESLIIKLKTNNKEDQKAMSSLQLRKPGSPNGGPAPKLSMLLDSDNGEKVPLSGEDEEMPVLERMVSGRKSPKSPRSPRSPRTGSSAKKGIKGIADKKLKKAKGTRVKSDLAFDQAEVVFLDHVPEDLNVDVSQLYVFNKSKQEAKCNICHRTYVGKMAYGHMREHLMIHTGERIWGCPYCQFRCNRRFSLYMHVKKIHPDMPIKLVRRRPYQINQHKNDSKIKYSVKQYPEDVDPENKPPGKPTLRGPRSHREREVLKSAEDLWTCLYCSRRDVFRGAIKIHMKTAHPEQDHTAEPKKCERPLELLDKLVSENQLPLKEGKLCLIRYEDMEKYSILNETLQELGRNLTLDLDTDGPEMTGEAEPERKPNRLSHAKYQCPHCSTRGVRPSTVKMHILTTHPDKELWIHDLRASRRSQTKHQLFVCSEPDCKFMTSMQQALYAHVSKFPTHISPGVTPVMLDLPEDDVASPTDLPSLRRKPEGGNTISDDDDGEEDDAAPKDDDHDQIPQLQAVNDDDEDDDGPPTLEPTSPRQLPALDPPKDQSNTSARITPRKARMFEDSPTLPAVTPAVNSEPKLPSPIKNTLPPQSFKETPQPKGKQAKKRRIKTPLPANHREGADLSGVQMVCKYCTIPSTDDILLLKEHLGTEHHNNIPVAVDVRQRDLRKLSRIHMCPMQECTFATYFEEAFLIHLNEMHSDVMFPFKQQLKHSKKPEMRIPPPPESSAVPDEVSDMPNLEVMDGADNSSADEWYEGAGAKSKRRRNADTSDDEPEWRPGGRRKRTQRIRKPTPTRKKPVDATNQYVVEAGHHEEPTQEVEIDWENENIPDYPSAAAAIDVRFKCAFCITLLDTLEDVKQHLSDYHESRHVFCMDLHAKHMRKKQAVFVCREPECPFVCKTFEALKYHLQNNHSLSEEDMKGITGFVDASPLLRNKGKIAKRKGRQTGGASSQLLQKLKFVQPPTSYGNDRRELETVLIRDKTPPKEIVHSDVESEAADIARRKRKGQPRKIVRRQVDEEIPPTLVDNDNERSASEGGELSQDDSVSNETQLSRPAEEDKSDDDSTEIDEEAQENEEVRRDRSSSENSSEDVKDTESSKPDLKASPEVSTDAKKPAGRATTDIMYQCSHCTYLSTDKENIRSHLKREHGIRHPEYTEIGAEFSRDGTVQMSVGAQQSPPKLVSPESSPEKTFARIEPLKLKLKTSESGEFRRYSTEKRKKAESSDDEAETTTTHKRRKSTGEGGKESDDEGKDSDDESEDDSKEESSSSSSSDEEEGSSSSSSSSSGEEDSDDGSSESEASESESDSDSSESKESGKENGESETS